MFFIKKGILAQDSEAFKIAEFVSSYGQSPDFEPMFREFVSSFGIVVTPAQELILEALILNE